MSHLLVTVEFLRGDVGHELLSKKLADFDSYRNHYSHFAFTEPVFARFSAALKHKRVVFITDAGVLAKPHIFPEHREIIRLEKRDAGISQEMVTRVFKEYYAAKNFDILWAHYFQVMHTPNVRDGYHTRAWSVCNEVADLVTDCPGDWIVSADHGVCWDDPMRRLSTETLHVPLFSNCLPMDLEFTNHDGLAAYLGGEKFPATWETMPCWEKRPAIDDAREYQLRRDGRIVATGTNEPPIESVEPEKENIVRRLAEVGY